MKSSRSASTRWFEPQLSTWLWKPVSWQGWLVLVGYYALLLLTLWVTLEQPHTTKKLLINTIGAGASATFVLYGIIFRTSWDS